MIELRIQKINDQLNFWEEVDSIQGNTISNELDQIKQMQLKVYEKISKMKTTWENVAKSGKFNQSLETTINSEQEILNDLEKNVNEFLEPYENAREFFSWTLTELASIQNDSDLSEYPTNGYDDIVLEEYLQSGAVIIMSFDRWIKKGSIVNSDLERRRIIVESFESSNSISVRTLIYSMF